MRHHITGAIVSTASAAAAKLWNNVKVALAAADSAVDLNGQAITNVGNVDGRDVSTDGSKLDGIEALADVTDAANVAAAGAVMSGDAAGGGLGGTYPNPTVTAMTGDAGAGGTAGAVPAPAAGDAAAGKYLHADGTWTAPPTVPSATVTTPGTVELATQAEVDAGTDTARAVTPATLAAGAYDLAHRRAGTRVIQAGGVLPYGSSNALQGWGIESAAVYEGDTSSSFGADAYGIYLQQTSNTAINTNAYASSSNAVYYGVCGIDLSFRIRVPTSIAAIRVQIGLVENVPLIDTDTPSDEYVLLSYSTARSDTKWRTQHHDGSTAGIVELSAEIPPAADTVYEVRFQTDDGTSYTITLLDGAGAELATATINANLPDPSTPLYAFAGVRTLDGAAKSIDQYGWSGVVG